MKKLSLFLLVLSFFNVNNLFAIDAMTILKNMDTNNTYGNVELRSTIFTKDNYGEKTSEMKILSRGAIDTLAEAISGLEKGQRILRTEKEVYVYYPDADQVVRLKGASLRQNVMGSTMSYEDLTSTAKIYDTYNATIIGEEKANGFDCWKLELVAKEKGATYPLETLWVDKATFVNVKAEYKSASGKMLRTLDVSKIEKIGNNFFSMVSTYVDTSRKNATSIMTINNVDLNVNLSDKTFSIANLSF